MKSVNKIGQEIQQKRGHETGQEIRLEIEH